MELKEVIFDFDGTIADSLEMVREVFNIMAPDLNMPQITPEMMPELMGLGARQLFEKYNISWWNVPKVVRRLKNEMHLRMGQVVVFEQVIEVIAKIKEQGITVGMLTSNDKEEVTEYLLKHNAMVFDYVTSKSNLFGKSRALRKILKLRKLKRDEVIYVGDEVRDVEACKKAGVRIVAVSWGFNSRKALEEAGAEWVIEQPEELLQIVDRI